MITIILSMCSEELPHRLKRVWMAYIFCYEKQNKYPLNQKGKWEWKRRNGHSRSNFSYGCYWFAKEQVSQCIRPAYKNMHESKTEIQFWDLQIEIGMVHAWIRIGVEGCTFMTQKITFELSFSVVLFFPTSYFCDLFFFGGDSPQNSKQDI